MTRILGSCAALALIVVLAFPFARDAYHRYEVARRLRQTPGLEKTVLVALTGWGQREDRRRSAEAGFDHHLVKPVDAAEVVRLLTKGRP